MKRIYGVLLMMLLSIFVSGYSYDIEVTVDDNREVTLKEKVSIPEEEFNYVICGDVNAYMCDKSSQKVHNKLEEIFSKNKNLDKVKYDFNIKYNNGDSEASYTCVYKLGDIESNVGGQKDAIYLYDLDFKYKLFTVSGSYYYFNGRYDPKDHKDVYTTVTLNLPVKSSALADDIKNNGKTLVWKFDSMKDMSASFKLESKVKDNSDADFKKIQFGQTIVFGGGIVLIFIVFIVFINISKKAKKEEIQQIQDNTLNKFEENEIFNSNANFTRPIEKNEAPINVMTEEEIKNHEDVISNKFLDTSFASDVVEEPAKEVKEENKLEKLPIEDEFVEIEEEKNEENSVQNDTYDSNASSLAFGSAPIGDKNINEIK